MVDLDSLLAPDHPARPVWAFVKRLELSDLLAGIKARGRRAGPSAGGYRQRAKHECINAHLRNCGIGVRGREKVRAVLLWFAIAHTMLRLLVLRSAAAQPAPVG